MDIARISAGGDQEGGGGNGRGDEAAGAVHGDAVAETEVGATADRRGRWCRGGADVGAHPQPAEDRVRATAGGDGEPAAELTVTAGEPGRMEMSGRAIYLIAFAATLGCASASAKSGAHSAANLISAEEIAGTYATNAYEAVEKLRPAFLHSRGTDLSRTDTGLADVMSASRAMGTSIRCATFPRRKCARSASTRAPKPPRNSECRVPPESTAS